MNKTIKIMPITRLRGGRARNVERGLNNMSLSVWIFLTTSISCAIVLGNFVYRFMAKCLFEEEK